MKAKTCIVIDESVNGFIPMLSGDGVKLDRLQKICRKLQKMHPQYAWSIVSGAGAYEVDAHVNEYTW